MKLKFLECKEAAVYLRKFYNYMLARTEDIVNIFCSGKAIKFCYWTEL